MANATKGAIRVLVVDDSALVRSLLAEIINGQPDMQCIGAAADPLAAREMIRALDPDVLTLDVEMPKMDGIDFLSRLMRLRPMPVVMVSTLTERGAEATLRALELGAVDYVAKPRIGVADGLRQLAEDLTAKIRIAAKAKVRALPTAGAQGTATTAASGMATAGAAAAGGTAHLPGTSAASRCPGAAAVLGRLSTERVIFIGASTGGTEATKTVLMELPPDAPAVMITQHMPAGFTRSYAARLDSLCRIRVSEASDGERVLPGHAYIAPGGLHLSVERSGANYIARIRDGELVNRHKPSVDVLFRSAARVVGPNALGVMLTGMGGDGAVAMRAMRDAGSWNVVQDEQSCVVFGMPKEAIAAGAAHEVVPLGEVAARLLERLRNTASLSVNRL